jgi:UDP-N-acetylmuramate dehydrogenase
VDGNCIEADSGVTLARLAVFAREQGLTGLEFAHGIPGTLGGAVTMNAGAYGGEMAQVVREVTVLTKECRVETCSEFDFGYRRSAFSDGTRMILGARLELATGSREAIAGRMEELAEQRRSKQPLEYPSAGSMFKRPEGYFAAALIDQCGLKGLAVGGAQVSEKHAGFVINRGGATCAEVLELVAQVRQRVLDATGVSLEMEVKVLG